MLLFSSAVGAAILPGGQLGDGQTSIGYRPDTGELFVDAPSGVQLTSIRIASAGGVFTGEPASHLLLAPAGFDIDEDDLIFKAALADSFGSLSFGAVAQSSLGESFLLDDLDVTGSLAGGGELGAVDLVVVPEPSALALALLAALALRIDMALSDRRRRTGARAPTSPDARK